MDARQRRSFLVEVRGLTAALPQRRVRAFQVELGWAMAPCSWWRWRWRALAGAALHVELGWGDGATFMVEGEGRWPEHCRASAGAAFHVELGWGDGATFMVEGEGRWPEHGGAGHGQRSTWNVDAKEQRAFMATVMLGASRNRFCTTRCT